MAAWIVWGVRRERVGTIDAPDQKTALALAKGRYGRGVQVQSMVAYTLQLEGEQAVKRDRSRKRVKDGDDT